MHKAFAILGIVSLIVIAMWVFKDYNREWKKYQNEYNKMDYERTVDATQKKLIRKRRPKIHQIVIDGLGKIDRCTTCHRGIANDIFAGAEQPYGSHPGDSLKPGHHQADEFGCTICHGGQGRATTFRGAAHPRPDDSKKLATWVKKYGWEELAHWEEPMLQSVDLQLACGKCHTEKKLEGAPKLNAARALFDDEGCLECHRLDGVGETFAADITREGRKEYYEFDFSNIAGEKTILNWHIEHLMDPAKVVPDTDMGIELGRKEAELMARYMLSLRGEYIPREFLPQK